METLRDKLAQTNQLIELYKEYLLSRGIDARLRSHSWMITERDDEDELALINEIAKLGHVAQNLRIMGIVNEAYLDQPWETEINEFLSLESKTKIHV